MAHKLLLLAGDGIGPEVMAEVKKLIAFFNDKGIARFETEEDLVGGCAYDAHQRRDHRCDHGQGAGHGRGDLRRGRRAEMGQGAV